MHDDQRPRRVIPRWRPSWINSTAIESQSQNKNRNANEISRLSAIEVSKKINELEISKTVPVASELMFLASSTGNIDAAKNAAQIILANEQSIGSINLIKAAKNILKDSKEENTIFEASNFVKESRKLLILDYNNPILHTDIALALVALNSNDSAKKHIRSALHLAPNSRFVTRAATRFFLHIGEYEYAHDILRRSPLLVSDPWIQASEIAVSTLRNRNSNNLKRIITKLDSKTTAECTELFSAVGTVELLSGSRKKAKRFFIESLEKPNDNSVAQAEWAASKLNLVVDKKALNVPRSFEANSHNSYRKQEITQAINFARQWSEDEPFASRPLDTQCYLLSLTERYEEAKEFALRLTAKNPSDLSSRLNLMFTEIMTGELDQSLLDFERLSKHENINDYLTHYLANGGALAYAISDFERGRELYNAAIKSAKIKNDTHSEALARAYFARMAKKFGDPNTENIISESADTIKRLPSPGAIYVIQDLVSNEKKSEISDIAKKRVAEHNWNWDPINNTLNILKN